MLSPALARRLLDTGLVWSPVAGDRFVVDRPGMEHDLFYLADMTVEVHTFVGGSVIGFNGVAEWALDSVALEETLWLPREDQLRAVLGHDFVGLGLQDEGYAVVALVDGAPRTFVHRDAEEAYGLATLEVLAHRH
ncbi:pilus assembly protein CpaE [Ornithinimicrobium flavum]|uniref:pilus assembly protein CpaE n=1 Tax=Ornithinimicrobium flavum TaxID=1288636 RepID=UPI00106F0BF2|nr:pilus assembly protein CpaE [Ornithinimicrobium flavum]